MNWRNDYRLAAARRISCGGFGLCVRIREIKRALWDGMTYMSGTRSWFARTWPSLTPLARASHEANRSLAQHVKRMAGRYLEQG